MELNLNITNWREGTDIPRSICSEPCPVGHIRNYQVPYRKCFSLWACKVPEIFEHLNIWTIQDQCCWVCVACREDAFVFNDTCRSCEPGWAPNTDKTGCIKLAALVIDWLNPWALVPLVFSSIGILCTLFTTCVFIRYSTSIQCILKSHSHNDSLLQLQSHSGNNGVGTWTMLRSSERHFKLLRHVLRHSSQTNSWNLRCYAYRSRIMPEYLL